MDNNKLIRNIIISQKDFVLLPRDKDGYCYYDGVLNISYNQLKELPADLKVSGSLNCSSNELGELPIGLVVMGNLWCNYNQLTTLPADLVVNGFLECSNNQLTSLPDKLVVNGILYCGYNRITKEIKSDIGDEIKMDDEQKKNYIRVVKINKLKENIHG